MSVSNFAESFQSRYQDILGKSMVSKAIASTRFESDLTFGDKVHRFKLDLSDVEVEDVVRGTDQTINDLTDSDQTLDIDQQKGAAFGLNDWDQKQAGPLKLGETAGREIALKVRRYIDADVLAQVRNATYTFDTGNLTTTASNGTPITLSTSNITQLLGQVNAQLQAGDVPEGNWAIVLDPYAVSIVAQHVLGKEIDFAETTLKNGFIGKLLFGMSLYVSNNLTAEAVLSIATTPTDGDTVTVQGVVFTFKTALTPTAGQVLIGGSADAARLNLSRAINGTGTPGTDYAEISAANRKKLTKRLRITTVDSASANTMTLTGIGSGRLTLTETLTDATDAWTKNFIHCFAGRKGAIDLVVQDDPMPDVRKEPRQKRSNVLIDALYGVKTFDDGANEMSDIRISA